MQAVLPVTACTNSKQYFNDYINYQKLNPKQKPPVPDFKAILAKECKK